MRRRHRLILDLLSREGRVDVVDVAGRLAVAQETVRRDLRLLEADGHLQRVHGGAVPLTFGPGTPGLTLPPSGPAETELASRVATELPQSGTILIGAGRLGLAVARALVARPAPTELTVVTNALDVAIALTRAAAVSVYNIGGTVSASTRAQEGEWAIDELSRLRVDVAVISPDGLDVESGLTAATPSAAAIGHAEIASARTVIALADEQVLGHAAFIRFAGVESIHRIAVCGRPESSMIRAFRERGLEVSAAGQPVSMTGDAEVNGASAVRAGGRR